MGIQLPLPKRAQPPIFGPYLLRSNGCMDQDATWYGGRPQPRRFVSDGDPAPLPKCREETPIQKIPAQFIVAKRLDGIKMVLGMKLGLSPGDFVLDGDPASLPKSGKSPQIFGPCLLRPNGYMDQDATWYRGRPRSRRHCVTWGPSPRLPKNRAEPPPQYSAMSIVAKLLDGWMDYHTYH